jgi:hypothetical protein
MLSHIRNSSRLAAGLIGFATTLSVAFFIGSYLGDGSHTGTIGSGGPGEKTLPIAVSFPNGELTPTHPVEVTASINNTTTKRSRSTNSRWRR